MSRSESLVGARYMIRTHEWPDPDSQLGNMSVHGEAQRHRGRVCMDPSWVVDGISCRQMYLRSYPFSREEEEETFQDKIRKCLGSLRKRVAHRKLEVLRRARDVSDIVLFSICSRLLSCTAKVNMASQ
ncbi:uncharacterized protein LOC116200621 [Punica granatum]|uniref:Uncharacterized protein n=2 Tax=Punica granatum TaxID=22663 RepID=A0A218XWA5_PUNGR|nr:uncharacterized protein LOC116200621 [Punica granatum]OWM89347.1 hypothetical protein CDL15_Pgr024095 [Punica granatum]PKI61959.1 hypothetical protein CRG98_017685 [Punica granatum]